MDPKTKPVTRPKDAASLILLRKGMGGWQVLMGRRHANARFLPGYYVFPGGVVDPSDARARPASALAESTVENMAVNGRAGRARAIAMACVRETFEETGLAVCKSADVGATAGPSWDVLRRRQLAPDLAALSYIGRAITPTTQRYRYHARFFMAPDTTLQGEIQPDGELDDLLWLPVDKAHNLKALSVTSYMLHRAITDATRSAYSNYAKPLFAVRQGVPGIWLDRRWRALPEHPTR